MPLPTSRISLNNNENAAMRAARPDLACVRKSSGNEPPCARLDGYVAEGQTSTTSFHSGALLADVELAESAGGGCAPEK